MKRPQLSRNYIDYYIGRFSDIRFVGQALFVLIVLLISWSGVKSIQANYNIEKQIAQVKQQNNVQQLINRNQGLQNNYYNSNQYLDLSARQNFGLAEPGETELLVPKNVAQSYIVNTPSLTSEQSIAKAPSYQKNFQSWLDFFLHKNQN